MPEQPHLRHGLEALRGLVDPIPEPDPVDELLGVAKSLRGAPPLKKVGDQEHDEAAAGPQRRPLSTPDSLDQVFAQDAPGLQERLQRIRGLPVDMDDVEKISGDRAELRGRQIGKMVDLVLAQPVTQADDHE